jgi:hypothetical protein
VSWRGHGRRGRGRRGDQDVEHESTAWLEELEKAAAEQDDDEEEWASKLRRRRSSSPEPPPSTAPDPPGPTGAPLRGSPDPSGSHPPELPRAPVAHDLSPYPPLGGEPAAPPPPPTTPADDSGATREPDYRLLGMEPDTRQPAGDWDTGWDGGSFHGDTAGDPGTDWSTWSPPEEPARDWERPGAPADWGYDPDDWRPVGPDATTGVWSPAEPVGREPDYPALFGELNRRSAAQREALWDSPPATEPDEDLGSPEPPVPAWPFEETTGTWEPSDRSFIWPAEELPAATGDWEPSSPSWLDEPTAPPPPPAWSAAPADMAPPGPAPSAPDGGTPPDDWAASIHSGVPPARAPGDREAGAATRRWQPDEAVEAEPAVPLGADGMPPAPPSRPVADQRPLSEPA